MLIEAFVAKLPKAENFVFIESALDPALTFKLAKQNRVKLSFADEATLAQAMNVHDLDALRAVQSEMLKVLKSEKDFYELTHHYLVTANAQTVRHVEIVFTPSIHLERGVKFADILQGINRALEQAKQTWDISSCIILSLPQHLSQEMAEEIVAKSLEFKELVAAFAISYESNGPVPAYFSDLFYKIRQQGFLTVAYMGGTATPAAIWQAVDELRVARIEDAISVIEDFDLLAKLAAMQLPISLSPLSDVHLNVVANLKQYPLKKMHEEGLFVTVTTMYPAFFKGLSNENYIAIQTSLKLSKQLLLTLAENALHASFMTHARREKLLVELDKYSKSVSAQHAQAQEKDNPKE